MKRIRKLMPVRVSRLIQSTQRSCLMALLLFKQMFHFLSIRGVLLPREKISVMYILYNYFKLPIKLCPFFTHTETRTPQNDKKWNNHSPSKFIVHRCQVIVFSIYQNEYILYCNEITKILYSFIIFSFIEILKLSNE